MNCKNWRKAMNRLEWCSKHSQAYWKNDCKHRIRIADEVCNQYFLFDLPWDMERTYEPVIFEQDIQWDYMPGDDPEFIYQLNRHRYWICLGQAYAITKDEKYAKVFADQFMHWIRHNPKTRELENKTWRTIEAGLRGENWTKAMFYFQDSPYITTEIKKAWKTSLIEHAIYLVDSYSPFRMQSNWGVLENSGLFAIAHALKEEENANKWKKLAVERLTEQIQLQVTEEGVHWEQSPMYHNEVLHCYMEVIRLAREEGEMLPDILLQKTKQMAYANLCWKKPNHCQPAMGDSDETDVRDLLTKAAYLFQDPILKYGGYPILDYESIWELGEKSFVEYEQLSVKKPDWTSTNWKQTGDVFLRSDWSETADYLHVHCGFLGTGHGHNDKTHFDLAIGGEDILIDCGRYHYVSGEKRNWFRGMKGHNVVIVDGMETTDYPDAWSNTRLVPPVNRVFQEKENFALIEAGHLGYQQNGVFINRKIITLGEHLYVIADECYTNAFHTYTQQFHCKGNQVQLNANQVCYEGININAAIFILTKDSQIKIEPSYMSNHYNLLEENKTIIVNKTNIGFTSLLTVIAGYKKEEQATQEHFITVEKLPVIHKLSQKQIEDCYAEAIKIVTKENTYVIIIKHQEVAPQASLVEADGCTTLASVVVFETLKDNKATVLAW